MLCCAVQLTQMLCDRLFVQVTWLDLCWMPPYLPPGSGSCVVCGHVSRWWARIVYEAGCMYVVCCAGSDALHDSPTFVVLAGCAECRALRLCMPRSRAREAVMCGVCGCVWRWWASIACEVVCMHVLCSTTSNTLHNSHAFVVLADCCSSRCWLAVHARGEGDAAVRAACVAVCRDG